MNWCLVISIHEVILYFDKRSIVLESSVLNLNDSFQRIETTLFEEFNWHYEELLLEDWLNNFKKSHWMKFENNTHLNTQTDFFLKLIKFGWKITWVRILMKIDWYVRENGKWITVNVKKIPIFWESCFKICFLSKKVLLKKFILRRLMSLSNLIF